LLKFHQIVFRKFLLIFSILFFIVGAIVYFWTKEIYISQTKNALLNNIKIISFHLQKDSNFDLLAKRVKNELHLRLTIIDKNGNVLAESYKDKKEMDNHRYRDEIMQADKQNFGYKIRHSETINKNLLYVAKRYIYHESPLYIRLSKELTNINEQIMGLGLQILAVVMLFFLGMFILAYRMTKEIESETLKITNFLTALTKKTKETYITSDFSLEFAHITKLLTKVSQIIVKKEKQRSKHTNKLEIANQQKDDIISAISHEFKNPIAVINGYSQTLLDDESINTNIRKKFLKKIYKNGIKLSELIDTLRLSIKLDNGKQSLVFTTLNLYEIVVDTVENMKVNYPKRGIKIVGNKNITIKADNALFSVVLANLIENALKYSEVRVELSEKEIKVIDTGIGISQKNLQNITSKFYRVHENSWNNSLGLGLFIVHNIIQLHNFKLEVQSKENEGSIFSIVF